METDKKASAILGGGWNNRIMKKKDKHSGWIYGMFEVFYSDNGKVDGWTEDPNCGWYENPEEIIEALELMLSDAKKFKDDILEYDEVSKTKP